MAAALPTSAAPILRDVAVTADVIAAPLASAIGTTGQNPGPALRTAVGHSIEASLGVGAPIRVAKTAFTKTVAKSTFAKTTEERKPNPAPPRARAADAPGSEHSRVAPVQVKDLELRSDKPLILAAMPLSIPRTPLPTQRVAESSTSVPARDIQEQTRIIRELLDHYTRSFETMDPRATKAVYPSVDDRALQKAYRALDGQQVRLSSCGVSIDGPDANALCRGNATYRPKVGSRTVQLTDVEWMFNLARGDAGWQIVNANARIR